MGCNCGKKANKGTVNHFSTEQQAAIARERGTGAVMVASKSTSTPTKK